MAGGLHYPEMVVSGVCPIRKSRVAQVMESKVFKARQRAGPPENAHSGETGHRIRFKQATRRSEATLDFHYRSLWPD